MNIHTEKLIALRPAFTLVALVLFLLWETGKPFYGHFKSKAAARVSHSIRNVAMSLFNTVLITGHRRSRAAFDRV